MALRELLLSLGVDSTEAVNKLKEVDSKVSKTVGLFGQLAKTAMGAFSVNAVGNFLKEQIALGDHLDKTAIKLGVSTDELQKFQYAAELSGVGADEASQALMFLNRNMGVALGGGAAAQEFAEFNVALEYADGSV
jgi:hypothetical protein